LNFPPGTAYEYCNTNTVLLGLLIERITGKTAAEAIQQMVLLPLKLNETYMGGPYFRTGPYTHGYSLLDDGLLDATNWNPSWGYTAGAMISTPSDLKRWAKYLTDGKLLSEKAKAERYNTGNNPYGFAMEVASYHGHHWFGHPGLLPGYNTQLWYNPEKKVTLMINSNTDNNAPAERLLVELIVLLGNE
jgi:D-alanyl-D-alanine carboxypeptidase